MPRMPGWFTGLQFRLILAFTATLALALAGVGLFVSVAAETEIDRFQTRNQEFRVGRVHRMIAHHYAERREWDGVQPSLEQAGSFYDRRFVVTDPEGRVVGDSHRRARDKAGPGWFTKRPRGRAFPIVIEGNTVGFLVSGPGDNDMAPALTTDSEHSPAPLSIEPTGPEPIDSTRSVEPAPQVQEPPVSLVAAAVNKSLFWAGLAAALGGILLVSLISRRILAPLQTLGGAAQRLGRGDLAQRVPASGPAEIRSLGNTFNAMAENLQAAEQQRRNLTADVAHELRTPLSNIQGYLDAVHDGLLEPDQATIATLRQQTAHLVTLVEDLRLLALAEAGSLALQVQPESLQDLLEEAVEAFRPRAEARNIQLTLELPADLPEVALDRTRIAQVVGNLLENAVFHTPEGGAVTVSAEMPGSSVVVSIADSGPGIAPQDLPRVFDRFYRVDPSRTRATGGAGLGLTIARQLVEAHGGAIWVESVVGEGAKFSFSLSLNPEPNQDNEPERRQGTR